MTKFFANWFWFISFFSFSTIQWMDFCQSFLPFEFLGYLSSGVKQILSKLAEVVLGLVVLAVVYKAKADPK